MAPSTILVCSEKHYIWSLLKPGREYWIEQGMEQGTEHGMEQGMEHGTEHIME